MVTFRCDPDLLAKARRKAEAENRTLTNLIETVLKRAVEAPSSKAERAPAQRDPDNQIH